MGLKTVSVRTIVQWLMHLVRRNQVRTSNVLYQKGTVFFAVLMICQFSNFQNPETVGKIHLNSNQSVKAHLPQSGFVASQLHPSNEIKFNKKPNKILGVSLHSDVIRSSKNNSAIPPGTRDVAATLILAPKSNSSKQTKANNAAHKHISNFLMAIEALDEPASLSSSVSKQM